MIYGIYLALYRIDSEERNQSENGIFLIEMNACRFILMRVWMSTRSSLNPGMYMYTVHVVVIFILRSQIELSV